MSKYSYDCSASARRHIVMDLHKSMKRKLLDTETFFKYDKLAEVSIVRFSRTHCKVFVLQKLKEDISM